MGFYGSNNTTISVKALKEVVVLRIRLQSHQVHLTMLQYYNINEPKHSEMGPVRQNPIQRTVRSVHMCTVVCTIVAHNTAQNRPDNFPSSPPDKDRKDMREFS